MANTRDLKSLASASQFDSGREYQIYKEEKMAKSYKYNWDEISKWRNDDKLSYSQIIERHQTLYGYAPNKSSISYHFGVGQKEKTYARTLKRRALGGAWLRMVENFMAVKYVEPKEPKEKRGRHWYFMVRTFRGKEKTMSTGVVEEWKNYFWPEKGQKTKDGLTFPEIRCIYTGKIGNVDVPKDDLKKINLDHNIPKSRGGSNDISNARPVLKRVNDMKSNMTQDEFIELFLFDNKPLFS